MAISKNEELAGMFKKYFSKFVENLDIDKTLAKTQEVQRLPIQFLMLSKTSCLVFV